MVGIVAPPPTLSTSDQHLEEDQAHLADSSPQAQLSDNELRSVYEINRTVAELKLGGWSRIALQFPDDMLVDAPAVYNHLSDGLDDQQKKLFILGDTSYGACSVDEIAAEHVDAEVVVHYGRACLSPTVRLPVIHVFTIQSLPLDIVHKAFEATFPDRDQKVIITSDVMHTGAVLSLHETLRAAGYTNVFSTKPVADASSPIPNRTVPEEVQIDSTRLSEYSLFHVADPPKSLLLTLASRVASMYVYPTSTTSSTGPLQPLKASTALTLRRRYGLIASLSTISTFGILINTLSVKNYMDILAHVKAQISAAGKKYYTFVVGKVNAAKLANFSEIGGWVVIGCWESSLVEGYDLWRPVITPFELELALQKDEERVWTGHWKSDFNELLLSNKTEAQDKMLRSEEAANGTSKREGKSDISRIRGEKETIQAEEEKELPTDLDDDSEPESAPPEYDLRTGRYVSHSRPMPVATAIRGDPSSSGALTRRGPTELIRIGGLVSPGAEYLNNNRTWQGLGSDQDIEYEEDQTGKIVGAPLEVGKSGIASRYVVDGHVV